MILRDKPGHLRLFFALRGSVLPRIMPRLLAVMAVAGLVVWLDRRGMALPHADTSIFTVFGVALSLFLGFRNNAAYDRWWEARRLWGGLIADLRALGREAEVFVAAPERRRALLRLGLAFLHLHRLNLRRLAPDAAAERWLEGGAAPHPPCAALDRLAAELAAARAAGETDGFGARALSERLASLALAQAGCERIGGTPLPFVYSLLVFRTAYLYCLLVPLGLIDTAGWMTPVLVGIIAYVFLGLAEVTEELEHPFGMEANGLPLDAMCRTVEIALAPHLGEPAPEPIRARDGYLS